MKCGMGQASRAETLSPPFSASFVSLLQRLGRHVPTEPFERRSAMIRRVRRRPESLGVFGAKVPHIVGALVTP